MAVQPVNIELLEQQRSSVLSLHPAIEAQSFYWERSIWGKDLAEQLSKARAVIVSQTVDGELYGLCRKLCAHVFPDYDLRFQWEGKVGDTLLFWAYNVPHPRSLVFPRVETLLRRCQVDTRMNPGANLKINII